MCSIRPVLGLWCAVCLAPLAQTRQADPGREVAWAPVRAGVECAVKTPRFEVLKSQAAWDAYWASAFPRRPDPVKLDWSRQEAIAIHLGRRGSSGYVVAVEGVRETADRRLEVAWVERVPSPKARRRRVETEPYAIVAVPASPDPVRFVPAQDSPADAAPRRTYLHGVLCRLVKPDVELIDDADALKAFWLRAFGAATPAPKDVDFAKWRLVAIALGRRPTPGYAPEVTRIARVGPAELQVQYVETKPAPGAILPQMVTSPFTIAILPRTEDAVSVQKLPDSTLGP